MDQKIIVLNLRWSLRWQQAKLILPPLNDNPDGRKFSKNQRTGCLLPSLSTAPSPGLYPLISRAFGTTLFNIIDQHLRNISKFEKGENLGKGITINSIFVSNNRRKDCVRRKLV